MSTLLERGRLLLGQHRPELAEKELRDALAADPDDGHLHGLLAVSLSAQGKLDAALASAREAVALLPDDAFTHYAHAYVLDDRDTLQEAEEAICEAIRLDRDESTYRTLHSSILLQQRRWREALEAAERSLELDPESANGANLRAICLQHLGRPDEALETARATLARSPENATAHASVGWTHLRAGRFREAEDQLREALRLEPDNEWAREGVVESLKARHLLYRHLLRYWLWMGALSKGARCAIVLGLYLTYHVLDALSEAVPALAPFVMPLTSAYLVFVLLTWTGDPVFNLLLRLHPFGRFALSRAQRVRSVAFGVTLLAAVGLLGVALLLETPGALPGVFAVFFLTCPATRALGREPGRPRTILLILAAILVVLAVLTALCPFLLLGDPYEFLFAYLIVFAVFLVARVAADR